MSKILYNSVLYKRKEIFFVDDHFKAPICHSYINPTVIINKNKSIIKKPNHSKSSRPRTHGTIKEISTSKIKNNIPTIKKWTSKGCRVALSKGSNPHSYSLNCSRFLLRRNDKIWDIKNNIQHKRIAIIVYTKALPHI